MAALEQEWLASGLPVPALMEKVGLAMAAWCLARPQLLTDGVLVLVGPGHNGGDGLVVARELAQAGVRVRFWCPLPLRQALTQEHHRHLQWLGMAELTDPPDPSSPELWLEALFGLGQKRPLPASLASLLRQRQQLRPGRLVSVDLPAGLDGDCGRPFQGGAAVACATLTVGLIKRGLVQDAALEHVGALHRIEAGVPQRLLAGLGERPVLQVSGDDLLSLPWPRPHRAAMKYQRGRLLVMAGSERYRGAASLALEGALASGAGSVRAALPKDLAAAIWQQWPEVVLEAALPAPAAAGLDWGGWLHREALTRLDAVLLGPGIGVAADLWETQAEPLLSFPGLLVLDADGLNQLAASSVGWRWLLARSGPTWITPHAGEFARLFPEFDLAQPLEAARRAADCSGAHVVLKGAHSVVAAPGRALHQLISGHPRTARTGLGDVLAGFVAGWGAQVMAAQGPEGVGSGSAWLGEALSAAVLLHGEAARTSHQGSTARDVVRRLAQLVVEASDGGDG